MNKIKVLPNDLINKIAAGEVVERPMSVVKELVENSIDARASKIDIFISNGGKSEIKVVDNGMGIEKNDLELSVQRHATSKLSFNNLEEISTLGFRGEALPSIASVSDFNIQSNNTTDQDGVMIEISSGKIKNIKPVKKAKGTSVTVRNLFFSTPARLKFLKSDNFESLLIKDFVKKIAICNFEIEFNLTINKKKILKTSTNSQKDLKKKFEFRIKEVLGVEFVENSVDFIYNNKNVKFFGLIGLPTFNYPNTKNQFIFINNRVISDKSLNQIFKVGFRDFISHDRFPQFVVFIDCPKNEVDINVHPAKNEVRFKDLNMIKSLIISNLKKKILEVGHKSSLTNSSDAVKKFTKQPINQNLILKEENNLADHNNLRNNDTAGSNLENNLEQYPLGFAKSQFHKNYIISQTQDGIVIVDQHAAHERIVYEHLKDNFYKKSIKKQILLLPEIIELDKIIIDNLKEKLSLIETFGLKIEMFGKNSLIIREVPVILSNCNLKKLALDVIEEVLELDNSLEVENQINKVYSRIACHGSIRSGREMQIDEMNDLLRKMEITPHSGQCNHGRPTYIELNIDEIEKLFGRK
tara:strand:+ start:1677 stop:3422 length:1746 start_codon:yes stop_codon:yes gene_type:complete